MTLLDHLRPAELAIAALADAISSFPALAGKSVCWHGLHSVTFYEDLDPSDAAAIFGGEAWERRWDPETAAFHLVKQWHGIELTLYRALRWDPEDKHPAVIDLAHLPTLAA
jgi:hypothetical protein